MAENVAITEQFNPAVIDIITNAFRNLSVVDDEEIPTGEMYRAGLYRMNALIKTLAATGIHVWSEQECMLFLQAGIAQYIFPGTNQAPVPGSSGASMIAMACDADEWVSYELFTSYPAGSQVLTLDVPPSLATPAVLGTEGGGIIGLEGGGELGLEVNYGVAVGDNIGVQLDNNSIFWTKVQAISGVNVTLLSALPSSASQGNLAFDFSPANAVQRPLMIPRSRNLTYTSGTITSMTKLSRQEYFDLPQQTTPGGVPTQFFYSPQRGIGRFYAWPCPAQAAWGARFTAYRELADFLAPNNTGDWPQEWTKPMEWFLSKDLIPGYSVPPAKAQMAIAQANEMMAVVVEWDRESEDVQFGMDWQNR